MDAGSYFWISDLGFQGFRIGIAAFAFGVRGVGPWISDEIGFCLVFCFFYFSIDYVFKLVN